MSSQPARVMMLTSEYLDSLHGGVQSHIYYLSRALLQSGHQVQVVRVSPDIGTRSAPDDVPLRHVRVHVRRAAANFVPGTLAAEYTRRLLQNLSAVQAEKLIGPVPPGTVVHQHDFINNVRLSKRLSRQAPVIWTNHLGEFLLLRKSAIGTLALRALTRHYRFVVGPSRELCNLPWMADRVRYSPNGVDTDIFQMPTDLHRAALRSALGFGRQQTVIFIARRWAPTKGVDVAVRALQRLSPAAKFHAVLVGAGESRYPQYCELVRSELARVRVPVTQIDGLDQSAMARYYAAADITLIPSYLEATSIAALEAMASGSIVVGTCVGGLPEMINNGVTGWLVPPGNAGQLAAAITAVSDLSGPERQAVVNQAHELVMGDYSWTSIASNIATLYRDALGA